MRLKIDYSNARKYETAFIEYLEGNGEQLTDLELNLLSWLSDDEVGEFAERCYEIEFIDDDDEESDDDE